jgi:predicted alpha/beta superfamily hydrolase
MGEMKPTFKLGSPQTGTEYHIYLAGAVEAEGAPRAAVLFMDGDDQFKFGVAAYEALRAAGAVPPLALVGVGYGASYGKPGNERARDYTSAAVPSDGGGGAAAFLSFLADTLWPELTRRVPLRPDVRGLAGHSLGSLLVLEALWRPEPFFNRLLASAPSLWWAERAMLGDVEKLQATGEARAARVFLSVGEKDSESMTGDLTLLEKMLAERPIPRLEVVSKRFPRKNHFNVLPVAFEEGLRELFGGEG